MEGIGLEVKQKIRSAIKAKLIELGSYVDDELPEYIMVMVRNRKTKNQMDDDLSLFLGHNTEPFTTWLHHVLDKLSSAAAIQEARQPIVVKVKVEENKVIEKVKDDEPKKIKKKSEDGKPKKEKKHKKKKKDDPERAALKKKRKEEKRLKAEQEAATAASKEHVLCEDNKEVGSTADAVNEEKGMNVKVLSTLADNDSSELEKGEVGQIAVKDDDADDVLYLRAEEGELELDGDEEPVSKATRQKATIKAIKGQSSGAEKFTNEATASGKLASVISASSGPIIKRVIHMQNDKDITVSVASKDNLPHPVSSSNTAIKKLEARIKPLVSSRVVAASSDPPRALRISSSVGAVLKRSHEEEEEDSKNEENYSKGLHSGIASKVEVLPRPKRTGKIRANTALILRAVADAHKSVNKALKRKDEEEDPALSSKKIKGELFTKNYLNRHSDMHGLKSDVKQIAITVPNSGHAQVIEDFNLLDKETLEAVSAANITDVYMDETQMEEMKMYHPLGKPDTQKDRTQFIVTLKGIHEPSFTSKESLKYKSKNDSQKISADAEEEFIEEVEEWEEEEVLSNSSSCLNSKSRQKITAPSSESLQVDKLKERCKFWPVCKNGDSCTYHHPTKYCQTFPNCKYGERCLFIHPNCKFDSSCARPDCPFTHASPRPVVIAASAVGAKTQPVVPSSTATPRCRFYPKCNNVNCPFFHPKSCKFGSFCRTVNCPFLHPKVVTGAKLKWTASKSSCVSSASMLKKTNEPVQSKPTVDETNS